MTLLHSLPRVPCRAISRQIFLYPRPPPGSSIQITIRPLHSPHPHHASSPLRLPPSLRGRHPITFFTHRFASSSPQPPNPGPGATPPPVGQPPRRLFGPKGRITTFLLVLAVFSALYEIDHHLLWRPLNPTTFVPFTITSREQVSPTAFILTVTPSDCLPWTGVLYPLNILSPFYAPDRAARWGHVLLRDIWRTGATWSVEVKQPQLQVAREYTPLPPTVASEEAESPTRALMFELYYVPKDPPRLRFLIRRMEGGEVSNYLSGLEVGDEIELRGPHYGFDVPRRLGDGDRVIFLAGGTGIAPALQVARAVLRGWEGLTDGPKVDILWANRHRADCVGCPEVRNPNGQLDGSGGPVLDQLAEIQKKYPGRVTVRCTVDEERSFVQMATLAGLVTSGPRRIEDGQDSDDCSLHSQEAAAWRPAMDIDSEKKKKDAVVDYCCCGGGKNLLFVSGPDGFIEYFAGAKRWANGMELQGPVGGILGRLKARFPEAMNDWLVLKL
ncbi:hypothetical protein NKR19_g6492 [Coniochaeta hoffmannii]|uniref:FAD-binding FR-type domain-containing protein n=1 Tax=Coniochaeta hoffmannii TaxID=91930 RepID=A0AA38VPZ7_9PEZI|nr:hypothetical protein NKR19_g6492 [Coniochaeta hoffmannii]